MAASSLRSKSHCHARSVSLPSRSHPLIPQFDEHLTRLRASDSEATSSSLPSISNRLTGLEDLYDWVNDLLLLPQTQQNLAQECNGESVDETLDGYLKLLDACATTKEIFSRTKEDVKELLSLVRRRRDASSFGGYLASRKKAKKVIGKMLKDLKTIGNKDRETVATFSMLKEVEEVTIAVFESLLSCVARTKLQSRGNGWSFVSKIMHQKSPVSCQAKEIVISEFEKVDAIVLSLISHKTSRSLDNRNMETLQNQLGELEISIQDVEEVLERLLRRLIKTRVSLLNVLNN